MSKRDERVAELRADRALQGLSRDEEAELARLAPDDDESLDAAAAAVALAEIGPLEPMPPGLAARLEANGRAAMRAQPAAGKTTTAAGAQVVVMPLPQAPKRDVTRWAGWVAAAACAALVVGQSARAPRLTTNAAAPIASAPATAPLTIASQRDALAARPGVRKGAATGAIAADVVWSDAERRGYMHVASLALLDPAAETYQVWIVDEARDARFPVDCGVIDALPGDMILALTPKLDVARATKVVVTREKPGGVVVSDREHEVVAIVLDR